MADCIEKICCEGAIKLITLEYKINNNNNYYYECSFDRFSN